MKLVEQMLNGEPKALARLITLVEQETPETGEIMRTIHPYLGTAYVIGITGLPGSGKSSIVDQLTGIARRRGYSVGIIAVDPTSPFTGGALLGDRIRMQQHSSDPGVFIRSMASKSSWGGLPESATCARDLLDAFGKDLIIIETVGVGQTELDIIHVVDTVTVVLVPEAGDAVQAMKAGLMEIGDIFVINKSDRDGAARLRDEVESVMKIRVRETGWEPPAIAMQAVNGIGVDELYRAIEEHRHYLLKSDNLNRARQQRRREELLKRVEQKFCRRLRKTVMSKGLRSIVEKVENGEMDICTAADAVETEILSDK
ncbi:MAG: putative GTPase ArgK [Syntrophorhabdus sp. PtaU1.Bin058]|nr:MAG: putative GTPase ArgK [Syntrophorhabdus sp. PtaU1.Bin058]